MDIRVSSSSNPRLDYNGSTGRPCLCLLVVCYNATAELILLPGNTTSALHLTHKH